LSNVTDLQAQATARYNNLLQYQYGGDASRVPSDIWETDPVLTDLHQQVSAAKTNSGETYNSSTGTWSSGSGVTGGASSSTDKAKDLAKATAASNTGFAYQKSIEDILGSAPKYTPQSDSDIQSQASTYADVQINPQITALQKSLQTALSSLDNQANTVTANYAGIQEDADATMKEVEKDAVENAISRGGGRSGVVEWVKTENQKPVLSALMKAEAAKTADLNNIANNKTLAQTNYNAGIEALETQRGAITAAKIDALKQADYAMQTQNWTALANVQLQLAQMAMQEDQFNQKMSYDWTSMMGETPGSSAIDSTITLNDYVNSNKGTISWNAANGNVTVNSKVYTPAALQAAGGYLENGRWMIPESVVKSML